MTDIACIQTRKWRHEQRRRSRGNDDGRCRSGRWSQDVARDAQESVTQVETRERWKSDSLRPHVTCERVHP